MRDKEEFKIELEDNLALKDANIDNDNFDFEDDVFLYDEEYEVNNDNLDSNQTKKNIVKNDDGLLGVILFQCIIAVSIGIIYVLSSTFEAKQTNEFIYKVKELTVNDFSFSQKVYDTVTEVMAYLNEPQSTNNTNSQNEQEDDIVIEEIKPDETPINNDEDLDEKEEDTKETVVKKEDPDGSGGEVNILEEFEIPSHVTFNPINYNGSITVPIKGYNKFTSNFGPRINPISNQPDFHTGIDLSADKNTNIVAVSSGVVKKSGVSPQLGKHIIIDHGNGFESVYGHCEKLVVKEGDKIKEGQVIAKVGSTGYSTGNHLHFAIKKDGLYFNPIQLFGEKLQ